MFWASIAASSSINELLGRESFTIEELLNEDEVLQKCREKDPRLTEFLSQEENVDYLVNLISNPLVANDLDTNLYRYSSLACEIITCDIANLLDAIVLSETGEAAADPNNSISFVDGSLEKSSMVIDSSGTSPPVISQVDNRFSANTSNSDMSLSPSGQNGVSGEQPGKRVSSHPTSVSCTSECRPRLDRLLNALNLPLNALSASFISRVLVHLSVHRGPIVIPYMRHFPNFMELVLSRFDFTAMTELVLQLVQQERGLQQSIFEWFYDDRLVPRLVERFSPSFSWEVHESVAHCLIQLILTLRNYLSANASSGPDTDFNTTVESGLPPTSPYAMLLNSDEMAFSAAVRLLDVLESEETINAILDRLTDPETVTTSIALNCIEVFVTLMDKRKPDTGFSLSDGGGAGSDLEQWLGGNIFGSSNRSSAFGGGGLFGAGGLGGDSGRTGPAPESIDKIHVTHASAKLARSCLPRVHHLHGLLQQCHLQSYNQMLTTTGLLNPPLGRFRLAVAQFCALLATLPTETGILEAMIKEGIAKTLMILFEKYPFNTLLHRAVVDFLLSLFTHAGLVDSINGKSGKVADKSPNLTTTPTATEYQANITLSSSSKSSSSLVTDPSNGNSSIQMDVDSDKPDAIEAGKKPSLTVLDEAFTTIVQENLITDWCLRLAPLPSETTGVPNENSSEQVPKRPPKPGYCGHLWVLANSIDEARRGARRDFVRGVFEGLTPASLASWDSFVSSSLATINAQQVADDVSDTRPDPDDRMFQLLTQKDLLLNLTSGRMNLSKFSLFVTPPSLRSKPSGITGSASENPFNIGFGSQLDEHSSDPTVSDTLHQTTDMWVDTDNANTNTQCSKLSLDKDGSVTSHVSDSTSFRRARIASLSSDESDPDDEDGGAEGDDNDTDDEEEELASPMVIKQQRSNPTQITPMVVSKPPPSDTSVDLDPNASGERNISNDDPWGSEAKNTGIEQGHWATFDNAFSTANPNGSNCLTSDFPPNVNGELSPNLAPDGTPSVPPEPDQLEASKNISSVPRSTEAPI